MFQNECDERGPFGCETMSFPFHSFESLVFLNSMESVGTGLCDTSYNVNPLPSCIGCLVAKLIWNGSFEYNALLSRKVVYTVDILVVVCTVGSLHRLTGQNKDSSFVTLLKRVKTVVLWVSNTGLFSEVDERRVISHVCMCLWGNNVIFFTHVYDETTTFSSRFHAKHTMRFYALYKSLTPMLLTSFWEEKRLIMQS